MSRNNAKLKVLVTGASRGIGRAIALDLAQRGYHVFAGIRDMSCVQALEQESREFQGTLRAVELDITDDQSRGRALATVFEDGDGLYALINNAGIARHGYFEDTGLGDVRDIFEANVFGLMAITHEVIPLMRQARAGRIIMMSSVGGRIGTMGLSGYVASKFAIEGFSESLWLELTPLGIHVSLVEPGIVKTDIWTQSSSSKQAADGQSSPNYESFKRLQGITRQLVDSATITPEDVAQTVSSCLAQTNPAMRYVIGRRARLVLGLRRVLPTKAFEALYFRKIMKKIAVVPA